MVNLKTSTFCPTGVLSVLHALGRACGDSHDWAAKTSLQEQVLEMYRRAHAQLEAGIPGVSALVSDSHERLNRALAEHGWSIRLPQFDHPSIGSVSQFSRRVTWLHPGESDTLQDEDHRTSYAAVRLRRGYVTYFDQRSKFDGIRVQTTGAEAVWLIPYQGPQIDGAHLLAVAAGCVKVRKESGYVVEPDPSGRHNGCLFPMVDVRHTPTISFMDGMVVRGGGGAQFVNLLSAIAKGGGILGSMLQENLLQVDELGARVESGTAGIVYRSETPAIRGPFLFVLERDGMIDFVALCAEDSFRDPKCGAPLVLGETSVTTAPEAVGALAHAPLFTPTTPAPTASSGMAPAPVPTASGAPKASVGFALFV